MRLYRYNRTEHSKAGVSELTVSKYIMRPLSSFLFSIRTISELLTMDYNFEIKLLLNPAVVLDSDHALDHALLSKFAVKEAAHHMTIQFMDTDNKDLSALGWLMRIRREEGKDKIELTYKKRYPITGDNVNFALKEAADDHFDIATTKYELQVEIGYAKKDLSVAHNKKVDASEYPGLTLPDKKQSRMLLRKEAPAETIIARNSHQFATDPVKSSRVYGPVHATGWSGTFEGVDLDIEVWPIPKASGSSELEYVVEASFKTDHGNDATRLKEELINVLRESGWLIEEDSLKTQLVLSHF